MQFGPGGCRVPGQKGEGGLVHPVNATPDRMLRDRWRSSLNSCETATFFSHHEGGIQYVRRTVPYTNRSFGDRSFDVCWSARRARRSTVLLTI